jgi:subtilase family serine protease
MVTTLAGVAAIRQRNCDVDTGSACASGCWRCEHEQLHQGAAAHATWQRCAQQEWQDGSHQYGASTAGDATEPVDPSERSLLVHPNFTSQGAPEQTFLAPGDYATIYNTAPLVSSGNDGSGVSIAIVGRSDISLSDVEAFRTVFGLPYNDPTLIHANDDPGVVPGDDEEAILDVSGRAPLLPRQASTTSSAAALTRRTA